MLRQRLSKRARPIRRSRSRTLALAAAAGCSSSRLSSRAASRVTGRPHLSSQGLIPHDREHNLPRHRARIALVIDRQRCRVAREAPSTACDAPGIVQTQRQRRSFSPDHPIWRPQSQGPHAQTAIACPPCHDQIAIARRTAPPQLPARSFPGGFRTTAPDPCSWHRLHMGRHPKPFTK